MKKKKSLVLIGLLLAFALTVITTCALDVAEEVVPVPFIDPYISKQPASIAYSVNDDTSDAVLEVKVEEWDPNDGTLSFQWYTFASYIDYLNGVVTPVGANSPIYNPTSLNNAAEGRYYFYVDVTNTNSRVNVEGHPTTRTISSKMAIISFNNPGNPAIPVITSQPENVQARFGQTLNVTSVRVSLPEDTSESSVLTYQWYQLELDEDGKFKQDDDGNPIITPLEGETNDSFIPNPTILQLGVNYFFVEVTHTVGANSVSEFSAPAKVTVLPGLRASTPVIIEQPKAGLYFGNAPIDKLIVAAESPDGGELTYQWYSNTSATTVGGTPVTGATGADFAPELAAEESVYYYVVVANTNENVEGEQTATQASRAVNVRRTTAAGLAANATIQIGDPDDPANRFNYIRGYGGMEVLWGNFPETYPEETELQYDPNGLGYNILRIMIPPSDTNIDVNMLDAVTRLRPHYYDNVKIVNKYNGYVQAAPWSPPKEWKSNNSVNGGGHLIPAYYPQYANYLKSYAQHMYNRGAPIYVISIQNEPNYIAGYDGCEWEPEDCVAFFKKVGHFTAGVKGFGGGKQIPRVLVMNAESANTPFFNTGGKTAISTPYGVLMDPEAKKYVDLYARHVYGDRTLNLWAAGWDNSDPIEIWMTEHNINSANATGYYNDSTWDYIWRFMNDVDLVMRQNNENAFVWWASKRFYSMVGDGQYGTTEGTALPRGWGLSHYAKYTIDTTRIGFTMTGTTAAGTDIGDIDITAAPVVNGASGDMDNTTARITAYVSQDGEEISMVLWTPTNTTGGNGIDMGIIEIKMPAGFEINSATGIRSFKESPTQNRFHTVYDVPVAADRKSAFVTLGASELISVRFTK